MVRFQLLLALTSTVAGLSLAANAKGPKCTVFWKESDTGNEDDRHPCPRGKKVVSLGKCGTPACDAKLDEQVCCSQMTAKGKRQQKIDRKVKKAVACNRTLSWFPQQAQEEMELDERPRILRQHVPGSSENMEIGPSDLHIMDGGVEHVNFSEETKPFKKRLFKNILEDLIRDDPNSLFQEGDKVLLDLPNIKAWHPDFTEDYGLILERDNRTVVTIAGRDRNFPADRQYFYVEEVPVRGLSFSAKYLEHLPVRRRKPDDVQF